MTLAVLYTHSSNQIAVTYHQHSIDMFYSNSFRFIDTINLQKKLIFFYLNIERTEEKVKVDLLQVHFENSIFDEIVFNIWRFKWVDMFVRINDRSKEAKTFININNDHEFTILIKKLCFNLCG